MKRYLWMVPIMLLIAVGSLYAADGSVFQPIVDKLVEGVGDGVQYLVFAALLYLAKLLKDKWGVETSFLKEERVREYAKECALYVEEKAAAAAAKGEYAKKGEEKLAEAAERLAARFGLSQEVAEKVVQSVLPLLGKAGLGAAKKLVSKIPSTEPQE